jgi:3-dehydroquinate synthase
VDASIGGKVGIDLNHLKNEIGVFNDPAGVFISSAFLNTLDKRQVLSGFAEVIKHALIADRNYWHKVQDADFADLDSFDDLIKTSVHIKNTIVSEDPREQGIRKVLNFGHTVGHALETFFMEQENKKYLLHGEAVAAGMVCEAYLSHKICRLPAKELSEISTFILGKYKAAKIDENDFHRLIELMRHDKKNEKGDISFALLSEIGKCEFGKKAKADQIIASLKYYNEQVKLMK